MKTYRIKKTLSKMDVVDMCIKNNYYTKGDCIAYENMLSMLDEFESRFSGSNVTCNILTEMAEDIKCHSKTEDSVLDIMNNLASLIKCSIYEIDR